MGSTHSAPPARDRNEHLWHLFNELGLLLWGEQQIAVAFFLCCQRSEDSSPSSEVGGSRVSPFLGTVERQSEATKILGSHIGNAGSSSVVGGIGSSRRVPAKIRSLPSLSLEPLGSDR